MAGEVGLSGRLIGVPTEEESLTSADDSSSDDESADPSVSLQLSSSVYDDAWLAPLVGLYGQHARGRKHHWICSLVLLLVNLIIQGMLLIRIAGTGGLLDEAQSSVDRLVHEDGEADIMDGICEWLPRGGEMMPGCLSVGTSFIYHLRFHDVDLDDDGNWTAEEAAKCTPHWSYNIDIPAIHANMLSALRKAALAVKESGRYAASTGVVKQAQAVLDQLARRKDCITREVYETQVLPFSGMCVIGDPLLCGNFFLRGALNRTELAEPLRSRGFEGPPLLFVANNWMGSDEVHASMMDICKVALERICPSILSTREVQFRAVVKDFCGAPRYRAHTVNMSGIPGTSILTTRYAMEDVYTGTVLTARYICFLALILMFWTLSMLDEFNQLLTWWRVNCGLLCCSRSSRGYVKCEDGAIEVISVPKWYAASALLTNVVPRTAICFALTVLGTYFLLAACSFQDLILNCVALTFLITVDEIMFMAVVPHTRKEWIGMAKPVTPPPQPKLDWVFRRFMNEIFWVVFITAAIAATLHWNYMRPVYGKYELGEAVRCLCQGSGRRCLLANFLGGYPDVSTALEAMGS